MSKNKIQLTKEHIDAGISSNNGWNTLQVRALGEDLKKKGWRRRLIGSWVDGDAYLEFLRLKDGHLDGTIRNEKGGNKACSHIKATYKKKPIHDLIPKKYKTLIPELYRKFLVHKIAADPKMPKAEQYNHPNWQRLRNCIMDRDNYTCTRCGNKQEQLHVHHLRYNQNGFIWDVEPKDLKTICKSCHKKEHPHMA